MSQPSPSQPEYVTGGKKIGKADLEETTVQYDKKNFYIGATDRQGNSSSIRWEVGRAPFYIQALMLKWVESKKTPYSSVADLTRDALRHRLYELEEFEKDPNFDWGPYEDWEVLYSLSKEMQDIDVRISDARKLVETAMARQDGTLLKGALARIQSLATKTREPYKSELQKLYDSYKSVALLGGGPS